MAGRVIRLSWNQVEKAQMAKDYYLVLGIGSDATQDEIRSAYRRQAKKYHPDCSGEDSEPFLCIGEAYEVLNDPARRRAYDEELARERKRARYATRGVGPKPLRRRRPPVEPLVPTQGAQCHRDIFSGFPFSSLTEEFIARPWRDPSSPFRPGATSWGEDVHVQVLLTREEALYGGRIRFWVSAQTVCPACRGRGGTGFFECLHCYGSGRVLDERPVDVAFTGRLADGDEVRVSVSRPGMAALSLVLHFSVDERW
jgi:DnaJ-class molecular chaperone